MAEIYSFVRNIVIFLLLAKILEYLMPNGNMKKYIRLFSGIILMIILINPIIKYNGILENLNYNIIKNDFKIKSLGVSDQKSDFSAMQNEITLKLYKEKIGEHIAGLLKQEDIITLKSLVKVEEDQNNEEYGMIREVFLTVQKGDKEQADQQVEGVKIDKIVIGENSNEEIIRSSEDILLEKKIKKIINNFYNLSSDNIHITIETC